MFGASEPEGDPLDFDAGAGERKGIVDLLGPSPDKPRRSDPDVGRLARRSCAPCCSNSNWPDGWSVMAAGLVSLI